MTTTREPQQRQLNIDGHLLVASTYNGHLDGLPVVFIHGITASMGFWELCTIPSLHHHFRCHSLSLPGHYPARAPVEFRRQPLTADCITDLLAKAIAQLTDNQHAILVGHSTGGFCALNIGARHPHLVARIICISGFTHGRWGGGWGQLQRLAKAGSLGRPIFAIAIWTLLRWHPLLWLSMSLLVGDRRRFYRIENLRSIVQGVHKNAKRLDPKDLFPYFFHLPDIDTSAGLNSIDVPTLVITGDSDPTVSPRQSKQIADIIPNARLVILPGVGHLPMFERPDDCERAVSEWLGTLPVDVDPAR